MNMNNIKVSTIIRHKYYQVFILKNKNICQKVKKKRPLALKKHSSPHPYWLISSKTSLKLQKYSYSALQWYIKVKTSVVVLKFCQKILIQRSNDFLPQNSISKIVSLHVLSRLMSSKISLKLHRNKRKIILLEWYLKFETSVVLLKWNIMEKRQPIIFWL